MSTHQQRAAIAERFLLDLAGKSRDGQGEDWQAGGALPDILHDLKREGHLSDTLYVDGCRLVHDLTRCHGTSAGLTGRYGEQVDMGRGDGMPRSWQTDPDAFARVERVLSSLRHHERRVLERCILARQMARGAMGEWGREMTAYSDRAQCKAAAVGIVVAMVRSISEAYRA